MNGVWPWLAVGLLGAYHGVNPAMGWLFAVAQGLQERSRKALLRALAPIAIGHLLSIALVVVLVGLVQSVAAPGDVRLTAAVALIAVGLYKFLRPRSHPRWVGMRIRPHELVLWSFLVSTAHGAGLMLLPALFRMPQVTQAHAHPHLPGGHEALGAALSATSMAGGAGAVVHTLAMFAAMTAIALLVFEKLGVGVLRRAWVNLDRIWAGTVVLSGIFTLVMA